MCLRVGRRDERINSCPQAGRTSLHILQQFQEPKWRLCAWHCLGHRGRYKDEPGGEHALCSTPSPLLEERGAHITPTQGSWVVREVVNHEDMTGELGDSGSELVSKGQAGHWYVGKGEIRLPAEGLGVSKLKHFYKVESLGRWEKSSKELRRNSQPVSLGMKVDH